MKVKIGYWAPQERYNPSKLLHYTVMAEKYGFETVMTSDHFHPWQHTNANAAFAWVWVAAAAERTKRMEIGTGVTTPTMRHHPAIVAQAFATLGFLYPGRINLGIGTGEALNEMPLGYPWPPFKERMERLEEAIKIIKVLWSGDFVTFEGKYFKVRKARLYTRPEKPVPLYIAASGPKMAELVGRMADGWISVPTLSSIEQYRDILVPAFEKGAARAGRDPSSIERIVELKVAYDEDFEKAEASCKFWLPNEVPGILSYPISDPRELEELGKRKGVLKSWNIFTDWDECVKIVEEYLKLGFTRIQMHSSSPNEENFIQTFSEKVLPYLKEKYGKK